MNGKGSKQRPTDHDKFSAGYDRAFRDKSLIKEGLVLVKRAKEILDDVQAKADDREDR